MWLILILIILWVILSGYFTLLPLVPGLIFIVLGYFLFKKIKKDADYKINFSVNLTKFLLYIPYIIKEIFLSNVCVAKAILKNKIQPSTFSVPNNFKSHSGTTIFANSVTLTPGTITLYANEKTIIIRSLTEDTKNGVLDYKMYNKVLLLEKPSKEV